MLSAAAPPYIAYGAIQDVPVEAELRISERLDQYPVLWSIAACESNLRQFRDDGAVLTGHVDPDDTGFFQINRRYHQNAADRLGFNIDTLEGNVSYGIWLYERQGTQPWTASEHCWRDLDHSSRTLTINAAVSQR